MRRCRILLLVIIAVGETLAPGVAAEATRASVEANPDITGKLAEARSLHLTDSTRSRALATESLELARARGDRPNEGVAHLELAIALRRQNRNAEAIQHVRQALPIIQQGGEGALIRRTLKETGQTFWAFGDWPNAIDYFQQALRLSEEAGDIGGQADAESGLGAVALDLKEIPRARAHQERALALAEKIGDTTRIGLYANNLGHSLREMKDYVGARLLYQRAATIFEQLERRTDFADTRADLAKIDQAEGNLAAAERTLRSLLPARRRLQGRIKLTATLVQLADVVRLQGKHEEALKLLTEANGHAAELASASKILVLDGLIATHEARGDLKSAMAALRQRQEEVAKQSSEAVRTRTTEMREEFAAERREAEIAGLRNVEKERATELRATEADLRAREAELNRVRWQRYGLVSALACGVITLGALISRQRLKVRTAQRVVEEAQAAQLAAENADRVKTRFLGIASRDIRGPLANIVKVTGQLRSSGPDTELLPERCDLIGSEAQRVISLVEDLIATGADGGAKVELRLAPMDLTETARGVVEDLRWQAEAKRQTIDFPEPVAGVGRLTGDAVRLQQVLANLLSNAIKFSPPGETIGISVGRAGGKVALTVRDRGPGLAPEDIAALFAPFDRGSSSHVAESSHGMGLLSAQEIVGQHGGEISVSSKPGDGAAFTISLPV